jgi:hypothetical protein
VDERSGLLDGYRLRATVRQVLVVVLLGEATCPKKDERHRN